MVRNWMDILPPVPMPRSMYVGLEVGQRWTSNAELMNLDTAITAMSALMIVMLVPSGRYLGLISYLLDLTSSYGLGAVSVCQLPLHLGM